MGKTDTLISAHVLLKPSSVACVSAQGYISMYLSNDIPIVATKAKGVKAMNLVTEDEMVSTEVIHDDYLILMNQHDGIKRIKVSDVRLGKRPYRGESTFKKTKASPTSIKWMLNVASTSMFKMMIDDKPVGFWAKDIPIKTLDSTFSSLDQLSSKALLMKTFTHCEDIDPSYSAFETNEVKEHPNYETLSFEIGRAHV